MFFVDSITSTNRFTSWFDKINKILFELYRVDCSECTIERIGLDDEKLMIRFSDDRTFEIPTFMLKQDDPVMFARNYRNEQYITYLTTRINDMKVLLNDALTKEQQGIVFAFNNISL